MYEKREEGGGPGRNSAVRSRLVRALSSATNEQDKRSCRDNDHEESEDVFRARAFSTPGPGSLTGLTERE